MKEIFDKLSSYNIFNYLLPGILFVIISKKITPYDLTQEDNFMGAFLYYFIGLVISRFGSIVLEPLLKKVSFIHFEDYKKFVDACKKDPKIELFSEVNNTYRTFISMLIIILLLAIYGFWDKNNFHHSISYYIVLILLLIIFLLSYRKQTKYISKRIKANN